jgi:isoleucyl-tRNA synthetase
MVGWRYRPPFDWYYAELGTRTLALKSGVEEPMWWRVIAEDFVSFDTGTGVVHLAPAFGEDDHEAHRRELARYQRPEDVELLCAINPNGEFKPEAGPYAGRWVKDADPDILRELGERGLLLHQETYRHDYPFCWRADKDPLIQLARPAWFIRTTSRLEEALANNRAVTWLPAHIKEGRFGDFLENNVDWALSRERYWGTPLNVWVCSANPEHQHAPASVTEIEQRNPQAFEHWYAAKRADPSLNDHLMVHKPWIDQVQFPCPECGSGMRRVPEVIDCWFDSGCMPFAQWGFPHTPGSRERLDDAFPADFISESVDQTRGWFYSLLMVSTLLFDSRTQRDLGLSRVRTFPHPYKACIVLGIVCDREGKKESKSRGNYTPPEIILDRVLMEFGVLDEAPGAVPEPGEAFIAGEDLDGMDLESGAPVMVYRADRKEHPLTLKLKPHKRLPRRVVLLSPENRDELGVQPISTGLSTLPAEVPRVPTEQRVVIEDPNTTAPGADAFRWFFYAASPPWSNTRLSLRNIRTLQKEFVVKLRNVYRLFTLYANIDGWTPTNPDHSGAPVSERPLLDRWITSELHITVRQVRLAMDDYLVYEAAQKLLELVESLSNWYVRRSRERFWGPGLPQDKCNAYSTLCDALVTTAALAAPFIPFFSEEMYQNLVLQAGVPEAKPSVHLARYPEPDPSAVDQELSREMGWVREIVSLGLSVRTQSKIRVRQPLRGADVALNDSELMARLEPYRALIEEELNVHQVKLTSVRHEQGVVSFRLKPNFRALGPRLGKRVQAVKQALEASDGVALYAELSSSGKLVLEIGGEAVEVSAGEVEVSCQAAPGFGAATGKLGVVVLNTELDDELVDEGILRELLSRVQAARKQAELDFTDRIELWLDGTDRVLRVGKSGEPTILRECLVTRVHWGEASPPSGFTEHELGQERLRIALQRGIAATGS